VRSIEFVIKVGAGTVKACLVLNYCDNCKIENGELRIPGIKITMVMFILLNDVFVFVLSINGPFFNTTDSILYHGLIVIDLFK
jgi:hypothetical protein